MKFRLVLMLVVAFSAAAMPSMAQSVPEELRKPFDLTTRRGDTYQNCRITKLTPDSLTVVHDAGVVKIKLVLLDDALRAKFGYDSVKASEFAKKEAEQKERLVALELERQKQLNAVAAAQAQMAAAESQPTSGGSFAQQVDTLLPTLTEPSSSSSSSARSYRSSSRRNSYGCSSCYGYSGSGSYIVYLYGNRNRRNYSSSSYLPSSKASDIYYPSDGSRPTRIITRISPTPPPSSVSGKTGNLSLMW